MFFFFVVVVAACCCLSLLFARTEFYRISRTMICDADARDKNVLRIKKYTGDAKDGHDGRKAANEKSVDAFEEIHPFFGWEVAHPEYE